MSGAVPFQIRLTLRTGSVYYFADRALHSAEPHFFIVVNRSPLSDELLILAVVTSQVDKVRRFRKSLPDTLVALDPVLYAELSKPSIVDCNQVFPKTLKEFTELFEREEIRHHQDLPGDLLALIRNAIHASPIVTPECKKLI
ncbi:MAG TPA: hypothetical protein VIS74_00770 [Chthoniobacterales bacterium]